MADGRKEPKSKYTLDRGMPGAFEGETVTRRRLMTLTAHGAGAHRRRRLRAAGARLRRRLGAVRPPAGRRGSRSAPPEDFPDDTYIPRVITDVAGHRPGRQDDDLRPRAQPRDRPRRRTRPATTSSSSPSRPAACTSAAPCATSTPRKRFVCPCHGGVYDFTRQGRRRPAGPPARPLLHPRPQRPGRDRPALLRQQRVPPLPVLPRPGAGPRRHRPVPLPGPLLHAQADRQTMKLPLPPLPSALQPKPKRPGEAERVKPLDQVKEAGIADRRLDRRAHVAVRAARAG